MKSMIRKAAALGLAVTFVCTTLAGCGSKGTKIDGSRTLLTVNGEDVRLGVGSFFAKYEQASIYQFYSMYFGAASGIFDTEQDDSGTYGDEMKESVLNDLKTMTVIRQHAEEYGVSLTEEETQAIEEAAQAYIDGNEQEVLKKIGAEKEDVVTLLTLQTYQAKMMDPIVKDVDKEVSDEEAQQTTLTYVRVDVEEEESEAEDAESEEAVSEAAETEEAESEETASEAAEAEDAESEEAVSEAAEAEDAESEEAVSEAAEAEDAEAEESGAEEKTAAQVEAREYAEAILEAARAEADIAGADLDAIAKTIDESYYSSTGQFTTNDPDDTSLDANIVAAVAGLADGELVDRAVASDDGSSYYVVRLDHNFDESATESEKSSIITERKQDLYDETTEGWVEEAEITVDEEAWKTVTLTDSDPLTLKAAAAESSEAEAEADEAEDVESVADAVVSEAAEAVESVADAADTVVSEAAEAVESVADAADAAVSEAVEAAGSAVSAAEAALSTAN